MSGERSIVVQGDFWGLGRLVKGRYNKCEAHEGLADSHLFTSALLQV